MQDFLLSFFSLCSSVLLTVYFFACCADFTGFYAAFWSSWVFARRAAGNAAMLVRPDSVT
jgi:hypothetical protein